MKLLCGASLSLVLALAITAPVAAEDEFKTSAYYPMEVNKTWNYKAGDSKFTLTVKSHHPIPVAGQEWGCAHVEITQDGKVVGSEDVSVQDATTADGKPYRGVFRVMADDKPIDPPVLILKEPPPQKGSEPSKFTDVWPVNSKVELKSAGEKQSLSGAFTEADGEKVTVGGTENTAVMVKSEDLNANGSKYSFKTYYVKDVGMVKEEITAGGLTVAIELEKAADKDGAK